MAEESAVERAMDLFGREIVARARDRVIERFDQAMLSKRIVPKTAAVDLHRRAADFQLIAALPTDAKEAVRRLVIGAVDGVIFDLLVLLHEQHHKKSWDPDNAADLCIGKTELLAAAMDEMAWPGLFGNLSTDEGWFARFSKYGEDGGPARS